jgi:hypothetical protein
MAVNVTALPIDEERTTLARVYLPGDFVAEVIAPRVDVDSPAFRVGRYSEAESFAVHDTRAPRGGRNAQITVTGGEDTYATQRHGLSGMVPNKEITAALAARQENPVDIQVVRLRTALQLALEVRIADLLSTAANWAAGHSVALSGTSQWSDLTNSRPVQDIKEGKRVALLPPTHLVVSAEVWDVLSGHPNILGLVNNNTVSAGGLADAADVARRLELDGIVICRAKRNVNPPGQNFSASYVWPKMAALIHVNPFISRDQPLTTVARFALTDLQVRTWLDPEVHGTGTGIAVEYEQTELLVGTRAGFLWTTAVA